MLSHGLRLLICPIKLLSMILPRTVSFSLLLPRAQIGPESRACHAPAAILLMPFSFRGNELQEFAQLTCSPLHRSAISRHRLTQTSPHRFCPCTFTTPGWRREKPPLGLVYENVAVARCLLAESAPSTRGKD